MFCPLMSNPNSVTSGSDSLYPCVGSCALLIGRKCSIKLLAQAQIKIANEFNSKK